MKTVKRLVYIFLFLVICLVVSSGYFYYKLDTKINTDKELIIKIDKNSSVNHIVNTFNKYDLLKPGLLYKVFIKLYTELTNDKTHPGVYKFAPNNTNLDIIKAVFTGKQRYILRITYPEGITLMDFASITSRNLDTDSSDFIAYCNSTELLTKFNIQATSAEGYLMPDTYEFFYQTTNKEVIDKLVSQNRIVLNRIKQKANSKAQLSEHEIITLASIVEAESPVVKERPKVAGVYLNRLRIGMKLDADPTVQYAIGEKRRLKYSDLKINHPYNTYIHKGLPPGPINSPSESSILAVLNPEKHDYIFFVSKGDGSGEHFFAVNYTQHLNNRARFKRNR